MDLIQCHQTKLKHILDTKWFAEVVNSLGLVLKMPSNKEIKRANSKEDVIKVKHQDI